MNEWRKITRKHRYLGWLLIAALAYLTVLPAHVHLHHVDNGVASGQQHEHVLDMHIYGSDITSAHHDEAQVLIATPDGIIKTLDFKISPVLIVTLLLALSLLALAVFVPRQRSGRIFPMQYAFHFSPPLRGPPQ